MADPERQEWMISVDDHVVEPPDLWSARLPAKSVAAGPHIETNDGEQVWVYPHADTSWPGSPQLIGEQLRGLTAEDRHAILEGTARRVSNFEPFVG